MYSKAMARDIGAFVTTKFADHVDVTAGGAGDATESDGVYVDRTGFESAVLVISWEAVLAATETLSLTANIQDATSSAGAGVADYNAVRTVVGTTQPKTNADATSLAATVVATGAGGGSTERGTTEIHVDLNGANAWIRSQITPDMSASATDTARIHAVWILGGGRTVPAWDTANN